MKKWVEKIGKDEKAMDNLALDIFLFLKDLGDSLKENQFPHLCVLSGRSTRL